MPYRVVGKNVEHFKNGKWSVKQHCASAENAHRIMSYLQKLEGDKEKK